MERISFKRVLTQIVEQSGGAIYKNAKGLGIDHQTLSNLLSNHDAKFGTIEKIRKALGRPAALVFYRDSDGTLVDLGIEKFIEAGTVDNYLGQAISQCRKGLGMGRKQLSEESKVDEGNLSRYERGKATPISLAIDRMSVVLQIVPDYLPKTIYRVHPSFAGEGVVLAEPLIIGP